MRESSLLEIGQDLKQLKKMTRKRLKRRTDQ